MQVQVHPQNYRPTSVGDLQERSRIQGHDSNGTSPCVKHIPAIVESISQKVIQCHQIADQISEVLTGPEPAPLCNKAPPIGSMRTHLQELDDGVGVLLDRLRRISSTLGGS